MASTWGGMSMTEKKESSNGKVSYFLNISIKSKSMTHEQQQPTVRIKIPKLLVKTAHQKKKKKEHRNSDDDDDGNDYDYDDDNDKDGGGGGVARNANRNRSLVKYGNPANKFITSLFSNVVSKFKNSASSTSCSRCNRTSSSFSGRNREIKEQVYCTSCRVLKKIRSIGSVRKELFSGKGNRKKIETDDEEEGEDDLCKRRILMGERCRPENDLSD